ncbi:MAG: MotA/TolQ/ExbB proton channel family protein [Chlamydiae bacterium]|nr:MAG: MotA/TolQ/ExbB proton channel family protein [Chlamydiota bacterium]
MTSIIKLFAKRAKYYSLAIGILLTPAILFAVTNDVAETAAPTKTSLFELVFVKGGVFMYIILLLSVGMVYLIVDAFMLIKAEKLMPENAVKQIEDTNDAQTVIKICEENPCAITRIISAGLRAKKRGKLAMEEAIAEHGAREASAIRTKISYLNTIATIAPMLGLLGTVSGMIKAFGNIATMGMGKASVLADNISEALITTAGGLVIAIPAMAMFFFFRNRLNDIMVLVEDKIGEIIEKFEE